MTSEIKDQEVPETSDTASSEATHVSSEEVSSKEVSTNAVNNEQEVNEFIKMREGLTEAIRGKIELYMQLNNVTDIKDVNEHANLTHFGI